jgi:hypothetical protein
MGKVLSEAVGLILAPQPTLGTDPTAGHVKLQPDKGTIQNWKKQLETVERNIHSKNMTREAGDVVGWKVAPSFAHCFNKDYADLHAEAMMRCVGVHPGGADQRTVRWTAITDGGGSADGLTHAALAQALPAGTLIHVKGSAYAANNGVFVVVSGSTTTSTKVATATFTAEAAPAANVTFDVIGFQAAAADEIQMNSSGHLTSSGATDFTTWDIPVGSRLYIGSGVLGTSDNSFATRKCNAVAYVKSVAANLIELYDHILELDPYTTWTPAADAGTGKTIRIGLGSLYRNYPIDNALYAEKLLFGEKEDPRAGSDNTTRYTYCKGLSVNTMAISGPLKSKITATANYVGTDATDPVAAASRVGGSGSVPGDSPAQAYNPLATDLVDTANDLQLVRMYDGTTGASVVNRVNSWTLTLNNGTSPQEVQGTAGADDIEWGEFGHTLQVGAYYNNSNALTAAANNDSLKWDVFVYNGQFGFSFCLPHVKIREDQLEYEANKQVKLNFTSPAFRNADTGIAGSLTIFGYVMPRS